MDAIVFVLKWFTYIVLVALAFWALVMGVVSLIVGWGKEKKGKAPKADNPPAPHTPAADHAPEKDHKGHGHDHHKKSGPISFAVSVLLILVGLVAAYGAVIWVNWFNQTQLNQMVLQTSASASAWTPPPPAPPESVECKGLATPAATIRPRTREEPNPSIVVRVPLDAIFSYLPEVADGTIKVCDYHAPGDESRCTSSEERRRIPSNAFQFFNQTSVPVSIYCKVDPK